jgi:hypothetical protein
MAHDDLVIIASFGSALEAELAKGFLEAQGVQATFADENVSRIANHLQPMIGGVKLQVRQEESRTSLTSKQPDLGQPRATIGEMLPPDPSSNKGTVPHGPGRSVSQ